MSAWADTMRRDPLLARLLRGGLAALMVKLGAAGLSFAMFLLLARAMGPDDYGRFGFGFSAATLLAVVGSFGMRSLVLRFGAVHAACGQRARLGALVRYSYLRVLAGTGVLGSVLAVVGGLSGHGWLAAAGLLVIALGLGELQPHVLRAQVGMVQALAPRDILWRLAMIGLALAALNGWLALDAFGWLSAAAIVLLGLTAVQFLTSPALSGVLRGAGTNDPAWRGAWPALWGSSVVMAAGPNAATVLLGLAMGPDQTGPFFAALRSAMLMNLFLMAGNMIAAPMIAAHHAGADRAAVQRICRLVLWGVGLPSAACFAGFVVAGGPLLTLFGAGFETATPVLLILSFGYLVSALAGPTTQILEMLGDAGFQTRAVTVTTLAALAALIPLSWAFGPVGAALALAGNVIAWNAAIYLRIWRKHRIAAGLIPARWMEAWFG